MRALCKAAAASNHTINRALDLTPLVSDRDLFRMRNGAGRLRVARAKQVSEDAALLAALRVKGGEIGLKGLAVLIGADPSNLSKVLSGSRGMTNAIRDVAVARIDAV